MFRETSPHIEQEEQASFEYKEMPVKDFGEAVQTIVDLKELVDNPYCLVDIDGTLIETYPYSVPGLCHTKETIIKHDINGSFTRLANSLEGNVAIITNRNEKEKTIWDSDKVLAKVDQLAKDSGHKIPFFTALNRQVPGVAKKRVREMAEFLSCSLQGNKDIDLFVIEDESIISPNREAFLKALGKELTNKHGVSSKVTNFVISKRV